MNIVAIIQARVGSTRFPGKIFAPLAGKSLIWHVVQRLKFSRQITKTVLATTTNPKDDVLAAWAKDENVPCFRGSEDDVLQRFYGAANAYGADIIVRITADDPFKDPEVIDRTIALFLAQGVDFAFNNNPASFPEGLDVEVFSFAALAAAANQAQEDYEKEHVTQFFYRHPEQFTFANLLHKNDISYLRWTIDTEADYQMACRVYDALYEDGKIFLMQDILHFLDKNPEVALLNSEVPRSLMYQKQSN